MWHSRPRLLERRITAEGGCATSARDDSGSELKWALSHEIEKGTLHAPRCRIEFLVTAPGRAQPEVALRKIRLLKKTELVCAHAHFVMHCTGCYCEEFDYSSFRWWELLLPLILMRPFRCQCCGLRTYRHIGSPVAKVPKRAVR